MKRRTFLGGMGAAAAVGLATEVGHAVPSAPSGDEGLHVRFLGSGSACWEKEPRTSKIFRRYSSVLIDGRFLIDYTWMAEDMLPEGCRPDTVIYTHSHGDHYDPRAAVKLGVKHVYLQRGWLADAKRDFERAVANLGGSRSSATADAQERVPPGGATIPLAPWTLSFPVGWGAPASLKLEKLASWTDLPLGEEGRHFSGTATYTATFTGKAGAPLTLDLGEVETVAEVFVNGQKARTLWTPPYRCEIGGLVKDGVNELRVDVTTTWFNRLAYDAGLPEKDRKTWTIAGPKKGTPPKPAGLLGPVKLFK